MHGDFSRGHRPDAKRGKRYLRGFAQQRRLLLDSDLNAITDAIHERLRELSRHTGCPKGSPDLGYLVTPGRLLALFRDLDGVVIGSNNVTIYRDYQRKYLDRYPSLHVAASAAGFVTIHLREQANGDTIFWCRAEALTNVTVGAAPLAVPAGDLQSVLVNFAAPVQDIQINLAAGDEIWIGLIETRQAATLAPNFDFAAGYFYLDGLPLRNDSDATWETNQIPPPPPEEFQVDDPLRSLAANDRLLAYLEGWERHVTFAEDAGILENALGGDTDTTTRGQAIGQVKLAWVPAAFGAFAKALDNPVLFDGTLNVTTPPAEPNPDPCALPVQGGYTGRDNRLYRFEVHRGGALGTAVLKWSRDNGTELFRVTTATAQELTFPANTSLQPGDLVEVLTEAIELGDQLPAQLDGGTNTFRPSVRAVGRLVQLQAGTTSDTGVTFTLLETDGVTAVTLDAHFGPFPNVTLKVRRWHGLIETTVAPVPNTVEVENGINIELEGSFSPGDYWQYEARADRSNSNGDFQKTPHGPERDFAPLALLRFDGENMPLFLERWLDDRFPPLCELTADDIAFDGDHIGSDSDTVQEIIEELWERVGGGCCEFRLSPPQGDAAAAIRDILDATDGEVKICMEPGVYNFTTTLEIPNRKVVLAGCPRAVLVAGVDPMVRVLDGGRLELEELVLFGRRDEGARVLIDMNDQSASLEARAVGFLLVPNPAPEAVLTIAVRVNNQEPVDMNVSQPVPFEPPSSDFSGPAILLQQCLVAASYAVSATVLSLLEVTGCSLACGTGCIWAEQILNGSVRSTGIFAGVELGVLLGWTPQSLLDDADARAAELGGVIEAGLPIGLGIRAGRFASSSVTDSRFRAIMGIAATHTQAVSFRGNTYDVMHTGLHIVQAEETSLSGETFNTISQINGVEIPGAFGAFGVQLLLRGGFSMTDCSVSRFLVGVALGAEAGMANTRELSSIQIQANQIDNTTVGIQLGPNNSNTYSGELRHVAITENNVTANAVGIMVNARPIVDGQSPGAADVRVADNMVTSRIGIGAIGRHVEVSDNRIHLVTGSGRRFGIIASNTENLVCEGNQVELRAAGGAVVMFAAALNGAAITLAGAFGAYLSGTGDFVALQIVGGSTARVADNAAHIEHAGLNLMGIAASNHSRLAVRENEFASGSCDLVDTDEIVFLNNTVLGNVSIRSAQSGMVCDNRVRAPQGEEDDVPGNFFIDSASGTWKVADNRADGTIRIVPRVVGSGIIWDAIFIDEIGYRVSEFGAINEMSLLAENNEFDNLVYGGVNPVRGGEEGGNPARGHYMMALSDTNVIESYSHGMREFVLAGARETLAALAPGFEVIIINNSRESVYQVMFTGNWARDLQVGALGSFVQPNPGSVVQVVANRADGTLSVQRYNKLVGAMNAADAYVGPLVNAVAPPAILAPNLNI